MAEEVIDGEAGGGSNEGSAWYADWRIWLGIAITVICVWYSVRGIPLGEVAEAMEQANFLLLFVISAPFYVVSIYYRTLRWRHLTNPIAPISRRVLFRSTAIGFMVNNVLPLRIGEFVRSWSLSRDAGVPLGAVLGTVVLERVIDAVSVLLLAGGALAFIGMHSDSGGALEQGSTLLIPVAIAPLLVLIVLRMAPERVLRFALFALRPFPITVKDFIEGALRSFIGGLGALSGGSHLFWLILHSVTIWLVTATGPILVGFWVFGLDLGSPLDTLVTSWVVLGAVGVAIALPSAPGFIGPYQLAFKTVLVGLGVAPATALAMGVLVWAVFWITLTLQGLVMLRGSGLSLADVMGRSK